MNARRRPSLMWVAVALVALLLASQALASTNGPVASGRQTGSSIGRAGFAYLGGLRTFAAAVLWNRIEPIFHGYYSGVSLTKQKYMIPSLYMVILLDPQFTQAYYMASFMVGRMVTADEGIALARQGVRNNPESGLMHANLAQLLYMQDKKRHRTEILRNITAALDKKSTWIDNEERYEGYVLMARMLDTMGFKGDAAKIDAVLARMRADDIGTGSHDHDGDGVQDH